MSSLLIREETEPGPFSETAFISSAQGLHFSRLRDSHKIKSVAFDVEQQASLHRINESNRHVVQEQPKTR
jgi:hypothetical protein